MYVHPILGHVIRRLDNNKNNQVVQSSCVHIKVLRIGLSGNDYTWLLAFYTQVMTYIVVPYNIIKYDVAYRGVCSRHS